MHAGRRLPGRSGLSLSSPSMRLPGPSATTSAVISVALSICSVAHASEPTPIPAGYHVEKSPRVGLVVAGAITFFVGYGFAGEMACADGCGTHPNSMWLILPAAGPFVAASGEKDSVLRGYEMGDGVVQIAGGVLFLMGSVVTRKTLVPNTPRLSVLPSRTPTGYAVHVRAEF